MYKSPLLSKTLWFNVLAFLIILARVFGFADFQPDPIVDSLASVVITLVNIWLRFTTTTPIVKGKEEEE